MQQLADMSADEFCEFLNEAIFHAVEKTDEAREDADEESFEKTDLNVRSFADKCILTDDVGLVIKIDGAEFRVTVQRVG